MFRQGDVGIFTLEEYKEFFKVESVEKQQQIKRDKDRIVLAYGEVTGHAHAISNRKAEFWTISNEDNAGPGNDNDRLLVCLDEVNLLHEEHGTIQLPAGEYIVHRQREYGPEELRTVAD